MTDQIEILAREVHSLADAVVELRTKVDGIQAIGTAMAVLAAEMQHVSKAINPVGELSLQTRLALAEQTITYLNEAAAKRWQVYVGVIGGLFGLLGPIIGGAFIFMKQ